ncbi:conserved hypothetical protein [Sporisorium reilianum SRZ2]|uniref:Uncharacterized protein n=1 Tax=Sporisorium reilianum (strain SRZ2) TaxID=999809 RepID=E6ZNQ3_SPORE|nr:conserved hypothetical protein [Sporisorium reilianum SRZ2]
MSLLADWASRTSVLLFGPPAPVQKDPPPSVPVTAPPPTRATSVKAALLRPNLGLTDPKADKMTVTTKASAKNDELPLPPPPEQDHTASSLLISTGASAISLLGSAVLGIGSAAVSALSAAPDEAKAAQAKDVSQEPAPETTMLGSLSTALLARAASARTAAIDTVAASAASLASTAAHALTDAAASTLDYATAKPPAPPTAQSGFPAAAPRRASTLPVQYTASGEPFSSDPSISAMQRIPDRACTSAFCCSAPDVLRAVHDEAQCICYAAAEDKCTCACHAKTKAQSGHFHRVEQLVKGTKRVVRDIKNVL